MTGRTFVDTNVLVYAEDPADQRKQLRAREVLRERADGLVLSAQVLSEFYSVVTRRLPSPMTEADAATAVEQLARYPVVPHDENLVLAGIAVSRHARLSLWDGLIVAAARAGGCDEILTEDMSSGATIAGALIVNPFSE